MVGFPSHGLSIRTRAKKKKKKKKKKKSYQRRGIGLGNYHKKTLFCSSVETFVWIRAETSGCPPSKRESRTCSSWKNRIIVIGGKGSNDYYISDVHILDTGYSEICLKEYLHFPGKKAFHAKVTKCMPAGYSTETVIDGKVLHGIVFTSDISSNNANGNSKRRNGDVEMDAAKLNDNQNSNSNTGKPAMKMLVSPMR